jgi:hypothetical protein
MQTHGSDRVRRVGERLILQSAIAKGWQPRVPKTLTSAEHPGTTVLWDDEHFEVVEATASEGGGVRYVLMAWRDDHTIRTLEHYDAASEALRIADHERAKKQRRTSFGASLSAIFLGFLPASVQNHLENELGVRATRMTLLSCLPSLVLLGICVLAYVDATMREALSPVPIVAWPIVIFLAVESFIRFFVVMSQGRPMGTLLGGIGYLTYRAIFHRGERQAPVRGQSVAFVEPTAEIALRDSLEVKGPLLTLLTPEEQARLAERYGYDYRRHAYGVAAVIFVCAGMGAILSTTLLSTMIAGGVALEQALRLARLRRGPAGSIFAVVVRPFVRDLLR